MLCIWKVLWRDYINTKELSTILYSTVQCIYCIRSVVFKTSDYTYEIKYLIECIITWSHDFIESVGQLNIRMTWTRRRLRRSRPNSRYARSSFRGPLDHPEADGLHQFLEQRPECLLWHTRGGGGDMQGCEDTPLASRWKSIKFWWLSGLIRWGYRWCQLIKQQLILNTLAATS